VAFKEGDAVEATFECRTTDQCIVVCSNGRVCSIPVSQLPSGRGDGVPLATLIEVAAGAKIVHVFCGTIDQSVLLATSAGYGYICTLNDMVGRNKAGKQFITIDGDERILSPVMFKPTPQSLVVSASSSGRVLVFVLEEMKRLSGGGKGVVVMGLNEGDQLASVCVINQPKLTVIAQNGAGREQVIKLSESELQSIFSKRARMGKAISMKPKSIVLRLVSGD
jgi:topoisomerase-4 subunit A